MRRWSEVRATRRPLVQHEPIEDVLNFDGRPDKTKTLRLDRQLFDRAVQQLWSIHNSGSGVLARRVTAMSSRLARYPHLPV